MVNNKRHDPYKNFKFLALVGGAIGAVAALGIFRRLFARVEVRAPGVHLEETPTGTRPIEGVGTSTAGFAARSRKPGRRTARQRSGSTSRKKR